MFPPPNRLVPPPTENASTNVQPTVQAYPGHIDPAKVTTELPAFVKTMQKHGLRVKQIRGGNQTSADAANLESMVATMGQVGATHYWCGTDNYDFTRPILPQLDAIKKKVEGFVKLNEKHGTTLMYHTRAGANSVGSVVWDLLYVMKDFDPKYVGLLESHDAGEAENSGGLVVADIGKGKYIYCSYSLFRQLPAGVPGAYRLLANLISLPHAPPTNGQ